MVRRSTWIVLGIFVLLVGFTLVFQRYQANKASNAATATPTAPPVYVYNVVESQINDIKIADNSGSYIDLFRDTASSNWAIEGVPVAQADSAKIKSTISQLETMQVQETLTQIISLAAIGLETPAYTITMTTSSNAPTTTYIGMQTAIGTGYYVRVDSGPVMVVAKTALDNILNLLKEPPLLPTATPEATPSESVTPTVPIGQVTPTP